MIIIALVDHDDTANKGGSKGLKSCLCEYNYWIITVTFHDSLITTLLKNAFIGNSKTTLVSCKWPTNTDQL